MNDELIKQWAKEADCMAVNLYGERPADIERMMRFAAMVAAHEREECAKLCDARHDLAGKLFDKSFDPTEGAAAYEAEMCAESIRGRTD